MFNLELTELSDELRNADVSIDIKSTLYYVKFSVSGKRRLNKPVLSRILKMFETLEPSFNQISLLFETMIGGFTDMAKRADSYETSLQVVEKLNNIWNLDGQRGLTAYTEFYNKGIDNAKIKIEEAKMRIFRNIKAEVVFRGNFFDKEIEDISVMLSKHLEHMIEAFNQDNTKYLRRQVTDFNIPPNGVFPLNLKMVLQDEGSFSELFGTDREAKYRNLVLTRRSGLSTDNSATVTIFVPVGRSPKLIDPDFNEVYIELFYARLLGEITSVAFLEHLRGEQGLGYRVYSGYSQTGVNGVHFTISSERPTHILRSKTEEFIEIILKDVIHGFRRCEFISFLESKLVSLEKMLDDTQYDIDPSTRISILNTIRK